MLVHNISCENPLSGGAEGVSLRGGSPVPDNPPLHPPGKGLILIAHANQPFLCNAVGGMGNSSSLFLTTIEPAAYGWCDAKSCGRWIRSDRLSGQWYSSRAQNHTSGPAIRVPGLAAP